MFRKRLAGYFVYENDSELVLRQIPQTWIWLNWLTLILGLFLALFQLFTDPSPAIYPALIFSIFSSLFLFQERRSVLTISPQTNAITYNGKVRGHCDCVMLWEESDAISTTLSVYSPDDQIYCFPSNSKRQIKALRALIERYLPPLEERVLKMGSTLKSLE